LPDSTPAPVFRDAPSPYTYWQHGMPKKPRFDQKTEVRKLARERIGRVKPSRPIEPKAAQQPKHKKRIEETDTEA
jgi:hypothetical protein